MTKHLRGMLLGVLCALLIAASPAIAQGPPWMRPVASSRTLPIGKTVLQVDFGPGTADLPEDRILQWVEHAAQAVSTYYGTFPVARARLFIEFAPDERGISHGTTWGGVGGFPAFTRIRFGQHTTGQDLSDDWMLTHEFVHTAFPSVSDEHHWIEEGLATYIEPIARVQAGFLPPETIWSDMVRDMPKGNPHRSDGGLDGTQSWGRTYWGGAQFCLLADVNIRKETHNRKGLVDALRAIVASGGTIDHDWPLRTAMAIGDKATGTHVLTELYNQMGNTQKSVDLNALWEEPGVEGSADGVHFDNNAPLASVRQAITHAD